MKVDQNVCTALRSGDSAVDSQSVEVICVSFVKYRRHYIQLAEMRRILPI